MVVGRILAPVHSLGPGERICIWTQGCKKKCVGCISPELQIERGNEIDEITLASIISILSQKKGCKGLTISGGDPFEQVEALERLLQLVRPRFDDILVYTGYELEEITSGSIGDAAIRCLDNIDVLIDGRYIESLNFKDCVLRGSDNQVIHYLNHEIESTYAVYLKKGRILENFIHENEIIVTGIQNREDEQ